MSANPLRYVGLTGKRAGHKTSADQSHFPCDQCGAVLRYDIGTTELACEYCGFANAIVEDTSPIREHSLEEALRALDDPGATTAQRAEEVQCNSCGARFSLDADSHAGECVFCSEPVVLDTTGSRAFQPESLLPLAIEESQAREACNRWLAGLWFAPSRLRQHAQTDQQFSAVFLPHWTYDSDTLSRYRGERGDAYVEHRTVWVRQNGRRVRQVQRVTKVRWRPAGGQTQRHFDDVLIGASQTLPRQITDRLAPWDLDQLVPYQPQWLSGSRSEIYQVTLDEGFNRARKVMEGVIRSDVKRDIGGDFQRVHALQTRHSNTTFKHILLPVWMASFRFGGKRFRFLVNARTGKTVGERPWSVVKIVAAVVGAVVVGAAMIWWLNRTGYLT